MQRRSATNYANPLSPLKPQLGVPPMLAAFDARPYLLVILVLAAVVRLIALNAPLLDSGSAAQATAASIARNSYRAGFNLFQPVVDWSDQPIISGLPLYHWLVALLYGPLQVNEWLGRTVSVVASICAVLLLYRIVNRLSGSLTGLYAALFLSISPLAVYLGRSFLPSATNMALALAAIHFFLRWADAADGSASLRARSFFAGLATLCAALAVLADAGYLLLIFPLGYLAAMRLRELGDRQRRSYGLTLAAYLAIVGLLGWRWYSGGGGTAINLDPAALPGVLGATLSGVLTLPGLFLLVVGLVRHARRPYRWFFHVWLAADLLYLLLGDLALNGERLLLFAPPAAAVVGMGAAQLAAWLQLLLDYLASDRDEAQFAPGQVSPALAVAVLAIYLLIAPVSYAQIKPLYDYAANAPLLEVAAQVRATATASERIVVTSANYRQIFYYADRRGWVIPSASLANFAPQTIQQVSGGRASFLVTNVGDPRLPADFFKNLITSFKLVRADRLFALFDLRQAGDPSAIFFAQTGVSLSGPFRKYWETHWAEGLFGFPITEAQDASSEGQAVRVQWFERARLEYHPALAGQPGEITLGRIGREATQGKVFIAPASDQRNSTAASRYFDVTDHTLSGTFFSYWKAGGGLTSFGYPISEQIMAVITPGTVTRVQWFERARMECVADGANECASINLGLLGREMTGIR